MLQFMKSQVTGFKKSDTRLKFSAGNAKLDGIFNLSLPAGHACPFAKECQSRTVQSKLNPCGFGIQDGPQTKWRCFAATDESKYPATRNQRWFNFLTILEQKNINSLVMLLERSLPVSKWGAPIRIHVSGDFFSQMYFDAWLKVAENNPKQVFYAYTKALPYWVKRLGDIPKNFKLTASFGGTHDYLIAKHKLKYAQVVFTPQEAADLKLELDHDDKHAYSGKKSFALLLHGTQPAGSPAAKAWSALKKNKMGGYGTQKTGRAAVSNGGGTTTLSRPGAKSVSTGIHIGNNEYVLQTKTIKGTKESFNYQLID